MGSLKKVVVIKGEIKIVNKKERMCMIFHHEDFDKRVYSVEQLVTMVKEVPETEFFYGEVSHNRWKFN